MMEPFKIDVSVSELDELRERLSRARLLPDSPGRPYAGMTNAYLADLAESWADFDWPARQDWLNGHPQFVARIDGARVHFVHLRSQNPHAPALLVMHGWPHTFAMQLDFADLLPDFNVVVPSLPGFGFSSPYASGAMNEERLAATMHTLMTDVLGYPRYLTYGEDVTANVNDLIAATHPDAVQGILVTHAHFPTAEERRGPTAPDAVAFFAGLADRQASMGGYAHIQGTRPDTLAAALNDSPMGLLAWLVEKFVEWSDTPAGDPREVERRLSRERLLTEAMIYWTSQSIGTSFRPYFDDMDAVIPPVTVPASVHIQRHEHDYPESVARDFYRDLRTFDRLEHGGHFAVAEVPADMAGRARAFARELGLVPPVGD
ncbi:epoxide hydrolase [Planctomonas sp. JC2975]|uniref:epoxide hydrolase family protein n=1 Tax=Planctomonas sp. JC2975 TaxID=2729626 RepID=UPI001474BA00|nr:epoxide hydrolase [Planctomonas sp. JC2975]NNC11021.1 epoxide hydrolase [Planctomonas sp. JC2975]